MVLLRFHVLIYCFGLIFHGLVYCFGYGFAWLLHGFVCGVGLVLSLLCLCVGMSHLFVDGLS